MALTQDQVKVIKSTVPLLRDHGNHITTVFYGNMLAEIPDLNNIFNTTNQKNGHQPKALAESLYAYADHIDDLGVLSASVERICQVRRRKEAIQQETMLNVPPEACVPVHSARAL